jgi:AsmA protein
LQRASASWLQSLFLNINAVNITALKPLVENRLSAMLGRQVELGELTLSILAGTVDARNLAVADDPQFSSQPFITATVVHIGVQMSPLILQQEIIIESLEMEAPRINLFRAANGAWNFSTLGRKAASPTQSQKQRDIPNFTINSLRTKSGHAALQNLASAGAPLLIDQIDLAVDNFAFDKEFPFALSAVLAGQSTLNMNGKAGPINPQDPANTNFDIKLAGDKLPMDELQSLLSAVGLKLPNGAVLQGGSLTAHLSIAGSLHDLVINGPVEFANIRLSGFKFNSR